MKRPGCPDLADDAICSGPRPVLQQAPVSFRSWIPRGYYALRASNNGGTVSFSGARGTVRKVRKTNDGMPQGIFLDTPPRPPESPRVPGRHRASKTPHPKNLRSVEGLSLRTGIRRTLLNLYLFGACDGHPPLDPFPPVKGGSW